MDFFSLEGVKVVTGYSVVLFFSATALIVLIRTAPKLGTMLLGPSGKEVSSTRLNSFMAIVTIFGAYLIITLANAQSGETGLVQLDLNTVLLLLVAMSPVLAEKIIEKMN